MRAKIMNLCLQKQEENMRVRGDYNFWKTKKTM